MSSFPSAIKPLHDSLATYLAKGIKVWSLLSVDDVVAKFPFTTPRSRTESKAF